MKLTGLIAEAVAYFLLFGMVLTYFLFTWWNKKELLIGIKGKNEKLDTPEIVVIYWLIAFPFIVAGDFFLNLEASAYLWGSMDVILLAALGISTYKAKSINVSDLKHPNPPPPPKKKSDKPEFPEPRRGNYGL